MVHEKVRYLGIDCAYTSLAYFHFTIDRAALVRATHALMAMQIGDNFATDLAAIMATAKSTITIHSCGVVDVMGDVRVNEVTAIERTQQLYKFIQSSDISIERIAAVDADGTTTQVLIEKQPPRIGKFSINDRSIVVEHQLQFYYCACKNPPRLVDPKLKNKLSFGDIKLSDCSGNAYNARKSHTKRMLRYLADLYGFGNVISTVPKKRMADLADALMTGFAYDFYCK